MGILESLESFGQGVATDVQNFGHDAQSALDQATRNTASLAGSGVNAAGQIIGPLGDKFGHDPAQFVLHATREVSGAVRGLLKRVAARTGKVSYVFPTPQGTRKVTATPGSSASANQLALTLVLAMIDSPATAVEEAGRQANGFPVKPRGLMGFTVFPHTLGGGGGDRERGLFGIDDAVLLSILLPIIAGIAVKVLPTLIQAASGVLQNVTSGGQPSAADQAKAAAAKQQADQQNTMVIVGVVVVVVLLGGGAIFLATRKKKAA